MDRTKAIKAIEDLLDALGEDKEREGLKDTPRRVADMYAQLLWGMIRTADEELSKTLSVEGGDMGIE